MAINVADARLVGIAVGFRKDRPEERQLKVALTFEVPWREALMRYAYQWHVSLVVFSDRPALKIISRTRWRLYGVHPEKDLMTIRVEYEDGPVAGMLSVWHYLGTVGVLTLRTEAA